MEIRLNIDSKQMDQVTRDLHLILAYIKTGAGIELVVGDDQVSVYSPESCRTLATWTLSEMAIVLACVTGMRRVYPEGQGDWDEGW